MAVECLGQHLTSAGDHTSQNKELYGDLSNITAKITRRLQFVGHCKSRKGSIVLSLITWQPTLGKRTAGRPSTKPHVDQLQADRGHTTGKIESCMENRNLW